MEDIFCKIIRKEIPCYKIYEDEKVLAILDISNDVYGHTLVMPKKHCENLYDVDEKSLNACLLAVKKIIDHYRSLGINDVNVINNSGENAEQSVMHLHFHILPRFKDDNIKIWRKFGLVKRIKRYRQ